jgi:hypothetical protein
MPASLNHAFLLPQLDYTVITPYLIPRGLAKKVNVGDGFILDSAIKLIGGRPVAEFSSRAPLSDEAIDRINASRCVVAVGANTLKDDFELTPGFDMKVLSRIKVPIALMGIGHYGVAEVTRGMMPASVALFQAFLDRFPLVSVRCDASWRYVAAALPDKAERILMTSCPVVHSVDGIDRGFERKQRYNQLVVTVTDRVHMQTQLPLLALGSQLFAAERRILALHQDYGNVPLWDFARQQGYQVFRGEDCRDFIQLYSETDVHFGNRVHAHLKCLSNGIVSFLTPFDLRQVYFAESLDFPLITQLPSSELAGYDFGRAAQRCANAKPAMDRFVSALRSIIQGAGNGH